MKEKITFEFSLIKTFTNFDLSNLTYKCFFQIMGNIPFRIYLNDLQIKSVDEINTKCVYIRNTVEKPITRVICSIFFTS